MASILLATFNLLPEGEADGERLVQALAERGLVARWAVWDDADVDWGGADLVAVRSTWDYHRRCSEFLAWARTVEKCTSLLNGSTVFAWNADKSYLVELEPHIPVVPTALLDDRSLVGGMKEALERWGTVVLKPRTGAGGVGVVVAESLSDPRLEGLTAAPWVIQPLVPAVRTVGETSVFVFDGRAMAQIDKLPGGHDIRVHDLYGGTSSFVELAEDTASLAERAVAVASELLATELPCARVDMFRWQEDWAVSELELIEPGLSLDLVPGNATAFAVMIAHQLGRVD